jgi:hypothetical protein
MPSMMNSDPLLNAFSRRLLSEGIAKLQFGVKSALFAQDLDSAQIAYFQSSMSICAESEPAQKSSDLTSKASFAISSSNYFKYFFPFILSLGHISFAFAVNDDGCPPPSLYDRPQTWKDRMRIKTLKNLDQFLNWSFGEKYKMYALTSPAEEKKIEVDVSDMQSFVENYGYFAWKHPIIAKVTTAKADLEIINCLLRTLFEKVKHPDYLQIAIAEVVTKALAYHDLKIGQMVTIPIEVRGKLSLERFIVERIFNLWKGMPAFGLVPESNSIDSILLYRGTDFSLDSQRGWASLMSDLDIAGPGFSAFQNSQKEISYWLRSMKSQGKPARVMGFSLGGALAVYTFIYENQWVSDRGSISICAPGVKEKVILEWELIAPERKAGLTSFVNMGDVISKVGKLFGNVYVFSTNQTYKPLKAHTMLMSSEPLFFKARVDVKEENESR